MRITPLASGSQGNATLVEAGGAALLIDAGLPVDELDARLQAVGRRPAALDALLLTHRHRDHRRGARDFVLRHKLPVWCTRRTSRSLGTELRRRLESLPGDGRCTIAGFAVHTVPLRHDAPETVGLVIERDGLRYGHVTDLGCRDAALVAALRDCDALLLEFNHDADLLWAGADPWQLKRRIAGAEGHLSNADAAALLARITGPRLRHLWLAHLSRRNNTAELAGAAAAAALAAHPAVRVAVALQERPSAPVELAPAPPPAEASR